MRARTFVPELFVTTGRFKSVISTEADFTVECFVSAHWARKNVSCVLFKLFTVAHPVSYTHLDVYKRQLPSLLQRYKNFRVSTPTY